MSKRITTMNGFVIGWSKKHKDGSKRIEDWCWFVKHSKINNGKPRPINRGDLEWYLNKCKRQINRCCELKG